LQEDVDAIGISILSGAHMTVFPKLIELMKARGMDDVLLTGGGIIPDEDRQELQSLGVGNLFPPGTPPPPSPIISGNGSGHIVVFKESSSFQKRFYVPDIID